MAATSNVFVLSATEYNNIKLFEEQTQSLEHERLQGIAAIFVAHNMQATLGISLLYRHRELEHGQIMVHETNVAEMDSCTPILLSSLQNTPIKAHSWFLNQDDIFQPFEYCVDGESLELSLSFLLELGAYFRAYGLGDQIAIIPNTARLGNVIEFPHFRVSAATRIPVRHIEDVAMERIEYIVTGWSFFVNAYGTAEYNPMLYMLKQ